MLRAIFKNHGAENMLKEIGSNPEKRPENLSLEESIQPAS